MIIMIITSIIKDNYTRNRLVVADAVSEQLVPDLPGEDGGTLLLVPPDLVDHLVGGNAGLRTPDRLRPDRTGFVVTTQDLGHTAVRHLFKFL